jgi:hypothetical protein
LSGTFLFDEQDGVGMTTLRVRDYAAAPGGRYRKDGPYSGEEYRDDVLVPVLLAAVGRNEQVVVELDGVSGYGSSFLEEVFGGLVRRGVVAQKDIGRVLRVLAKEHLFKPQQMLVERYMQKAQAETMPQR